MKAAVLTALKEPLQILDLEQEAPVRARCA